MVSRCIYISLCRHSCEIRLDHNFEKFANYLGQELVSVRSEWRKYKHPHFALGLVLRRSAVLSPVIHHRPHLNIPCYPPWSSFFDISQGASTLRGIHVITSFWLQSKKTQVKSSSNFIEASIVVSFYYYATRLYWLLFLWEVQRAK